MALTKVRGSGIDADGQEIILDADQDSTLSVDTDDQVDIKLGGNDQVVVATGSTAFKAPDGGSRYALNGMGNSDSAELSLYDSSDAQKVRIGAGADTFFNGGNVGIGTTSPATLLHVENSGGNGSMQLISSTSGTSFINMGDTSDADAGQLSYINNDNAMAFKVNASERMRVHSGGVVSVGTTSTGGNSILTLSTGNFTHGIKQFCNNGQTSYHVEVGGSTVGSISHTTSSTSYNTSSDYRLKENVVTDWDATTRLKQLKPSRFNFKVDADTTVDGFLAHEVSSIVPEAISGEKDAMTKEVLYVEGDKIPEGKKVGDVKKPSQIDPQGIDQSKLVPLLTKALQEAISEIDTLKEKVTALESK